MFLVVGKTVLASADSYLPCTVVKPHLIRGELLTFETQEEAEKFAVQIVERGDAKVCSIFEEVMEVKVSIYQNSNLGSV